MFDTESEKIDLNSIISNNIKIDFNPEDKLYFIENFSKNDNNIKKNYENPNSEKIKNNSLIKEKASTLIQENSSINNLINFQEDQNLIVEIRKKEKKIKIKPGRKNKAINNKEHNKYSTDNIFRKCKHLVIKNLLEFINYKIRYFYKENIGKGVFKKELKILKQYQISNSNIKFNQDFLGKTIKDIFSENISGRYSVLFFDHNKTIIQNLINEKDENIKKYFTKLFNLNFRECLNHYIEKENIDELHGLKYFSQIKDEIMNEYPEDGEYYYNNLKYYLENFEKTLYYKKARCRKENKNINKIVKI